MRKKFKKLFNIARVKKIENDSKVFCISMQRTGTTSTGQFLRDHGYRCIGWGGDRDNRWSEDWLNKNYEKIFKSIDFRISNAYEDSPWWMPDFFKILDEKFPNSKYILLERDHNKWFNSMASHSAGNTPGALKVHCKVYNREAELANLNLTSEQISKIDGTKALKITEEHRQHYIDCYKNHTQNAFGYFKESNKLFHGELEDPHVWKKLANFLKIDIKDGYQALKNVTATSERRQGLK
jgi:hypothetical protein